MSADTTPKGQEQEMQTAEAVLYPPLNTNQSAVAKATVLPYSPQSPSDYNGVINVIIENDASLHFCTWEESFKRALADKEITEESEKPNIETTSVLKRPMSIFRCYYELWKTRLSVLVVFTTAAGYYSAGGWKQPWKSQVGLMTGTFLQAACANSLNEIIETDRDALMQRTMNRPLPTGRITKTHALLQAAAAGATGTYLLFKHTNNATAWLGFANIVIYAGVYTPLKVRHWLNTWVGTVNGSLPPLMGSTAATGMLLHPTGIYTFATMYLWQITHFMAICYKCKADYHKAGYKMLSIEDPDRAAFQAVAHAALFFPLCWATGPWGMDLAPWWFPVVSTYINYKYLMAPSLVFKRQVNYTNATNLFFASLKHLSILFTLGIAAFALHWETREKSASSNNGNGVVSKCLSYLGSSLGKVIDYGKSFF